MSDAKLYRWGGLAAVVGAILALVGNLLHPRITSFEDPALDTVRKVAGSGAWIPLHIILVASILLIAVGLFALARSMKQGPAEGLARLALGSLLVSTPVALVTLGIDGFSSKDVADAWATASGPDKAPAFAAAVAVAAVAWGAFLVMIITFIGLTPLLFGVAIASSGQYPGILGWPVAAVGAGAIVAGVVGFGGQSAVFWVLFVATSGLLTLWVLAMGVSLARKAVVTEPVRAGG